MSFIRKTKEQAKEELIKLIDIFKQNEKYYRSEEYLEANVKTEFINKFLIILNWDVNNENNVAPKFKEVIMEAKTEDVKGVVKHPDYALCVGGNPVLFLEAKPPYVKVLNSATYALQLRKYAFSSKKPLSILTDFEELAVYDTRKKPNDEDEADKTRIKYITYDKYVEEFDYLWDTFSYDAVIKGSIENYFNNDDGNYMTNDVDNEILEAIEEWRQLFIKSLRTKKGNITEQNVNMAVQKLINRILFIWRDKGF